MGVYLVFREYDTDWNKDRKKIGELCLSYFNKISENGIAKMIKLIEASTNEYSMPCPYGGHMEILFRDELEELIKTLKAIKVSSYRIKEKRHIIKVLENVLSYMGNHQLGAVSKEWW